MKAITWVKENSLTSGFLIALTVVSLAFGLSVVLFGMDSFMAGAHDTFHDFRHSIGMPCH